jgi:hypothetical protein
MLKATVRANSPALPEATAKHPDADLIAFGQSSPSSRPTLARRFRLWARFSSSKSKTSCQRMLRA